MVCPIRLSKGELVNFNHTGSLLRQLVGELEPQQAQSVRGSSLR